MRFPYQQYAVVPSLDFPDGAIRRPEVPLRVTGRTASETLIALVDTGADATLLPRSTLEAVGAEVDEEETSKVAGIGGRDIEVTAGKVTLALERDGQVFSWTAHVHFISEELAADVGAILGHAGCLHFFRATFDGHDREVELVPTPDFPGSIQRE